MNRERREQDHAEKHVNFQFELFWQSVRADHRCGAGCVYCQQPAENVTFPSLLDAFLKLHPKLESHRNRLLKTSLDSSFRVLSAAWREAAA